MKSESGGLPFFWLPLACLFVLGGFLRLHGLADQILVCDEWHGPNQVAANSALGVLTDFNPTDNTSLPLNLYNLALYHSAGWSEWGLRLPEPFSWRTVGQSR